MLREPATQLLAVLDRCLSRIGLDKEQSGRWRAARSGADLLDGLRRAEEAGLVETFVKASLEPTAQAIGATLSRAAATAVALDNSGWPALEQALRLADTNAAAAEIRERTLMSFGTTSTQHRKPDGSTASSQKLQHSSLGSPCQGPPCPVRDLAAAAALRRQANPTPARGFTRIDAGRKEHLEPDAASSRTRASPGLVAGDPALRLTLDWIVEREETA